MIWNLYLRLDVRTMGSCIDGLDVSMFMAGSSIRGLMVLFLP